MTVNAKEIWIKQGYEMFAHSGQSGLKVEPLAKTVGKSKSSFYHHFADLEVFTAMLLSYHLEQSKIIAKKEQNAQSIDPELIYVLVEHKTDLLFNRQLRIHQNVPAFAATLAQSNTIIGNAFVTTWVKDLDLELTEKQIDAIFSLAIENFFLQINTETLHYEWLSHYFKNLKTIAGNFG